MRIECKFKRYAAVISKISYYFRRNKMDKRKLKMITNTLNAQVLSVLKHPTKYAHAEFDNNAQLNEEIIIIL